MRNSCFFSLLAFCLASLGTHVTLADDHVSMLPVEFSKVTIDSSFWSPWQETNRRVSIPHNLDTCDATGRIDNFRHAAGVTPEGKFQGHIFHDSDVYKVLEGVAYSLHTHPDKALAARLESIIDLIAAAQQPDGYVNTWFTVAQPDGRWKNLGADHELYCAGHMFEAAVAHYYATGSRKFLDVACRFADYIDSVFGEGKRYGIAGHPEIELALVKLWRATGEERYLNLARFLVAEHGNSQHRQLLGEYAQDHLPVRAQTEPVGHAVRFLYFYSGVADLAAIDGNPDYIQAMDQLWDYIIHKKMYLTGGVGVQGYGEGFANAYDLPNHDAYCETCASIGMVFWNHRLALLHGDGKYADLVEQLLYNGALSGISLDGSKFFYVNPLASHGDHHRQPWYGCACCPTNVVRFVASLGQYPYALLSDEPGICVLQYVGGETTLDVKSTNVRLRQQTNFPWDGDVKLIVEPEKSAEFTVRIRIPGWCPDATLQLNGRPYALSVAHGFADIRRTWNSGDTINLSLPMPARQVEANPLVPAQTGKMAVMRGPMVYCLEDVDHSCDVDHIALSESAEFQVKHQPDLLGGVSVVTTQGACQEIRETAEGWQAERSSVALTLVPYYAWDNRAPGKMAVWIPTELPKLPSVEQATLAVVARPSASHCNSADSVAAINDNQLPKSSADHSIPRMTWWDHRGSNEWAELSFQKPHEISQAAVYWFDDSGQGSCRVPAGWKLLYRDGDTWKPVDASTPYGVDRDGWNTVQFAPVTTTALRLEAELQQGYSGGILEWTLP